MTGLHRARAALWRLGVDMQRYPASDPLYPVARILSAHRFDHVLDVGANDGGFATAIRRLGYAGQIWSFEPLSRPFARLRAASAGDDSWRVEQVAVGAGRDPVVVNVAGNNQASSSVLGMLDTHVDAAPGSAFVGTETVAQTTLVDVLAQIPEGSRVYLKLDVQGYERFVLEGAGDSLARVSAVQMEVAFVPLYDGGWLWREAVDYVAAAGLRVASVLPGFTDPRTGEMLQADFVLVR
jgi:FkbM family methyltransferase